jgi:hypothetical protein
MHRRALARYTDDGLLEIYSSVAERALCAVAPGRKNFLLAMLLLFRRFPGQGMNLYDDLPFIGAMRHQFTRVSPLDSLC